jgi:hypothetical protein
VLKGLLEALQAGCEPLDFADLHLHADGAYDGVEELPGHRRCSLVYVLGHHVVCQVREARLYVDELPTRLVSSAPRLPSTAPLGIGRIMWDTASAKSSRRSFYCTAILSFALSARRLRAMI